MNASRKNGSRFQYNATVDYIQPLYSAITASLCGDRKHGRAHPALYAKGDLLTRLFDLKEETQLVAWASWSFNEADQRILYHAVPLFLPQL